MKNKKTIYELVDIAKENLQLFEKHQLTKKECHIIGTFVWDKFIDESDMIKDE